MRDQLFNKNSEIKKLDSVHDLYVFTQKKKNKSVINYQDLIKETSSKKSKFIKNRKYITLNRAHINHKL